MKKIILGLLALVSLSFVASADENDLLVKTPCGQEGSVDERIKDCSSQPDSETNGFVLVARSKHFKEVRIEKSSNFLWSDRLPYTADSWFAADLCESNQEEFVGISDLEWSLPSINQFKSAESNGIRDALPNMQYQFWSSTMFDNNAPNWLRNYDDGMTFDGRNGSTYRQPLTHSYYSVRCVAYVPRR